MVIEVVQSVDSLGRANYFFEITLDDHGIVAELVKFIHSEKLTNRSRKYHPVLGWAREKRIQGVLPYKLAILGNPPEVPEEVKERLIQMLVQGLRIKGTELAE